MEQIVAMEWQGSTRRRFHAEFWKGFEELSIMAELPSGLPDTIAAEEDLARFLTQSSQFNSLMAKPSAFLPSPKYRETSVFRHGNEPLKELWELGEDAANTRNLHGAAIVKASVVEDCLLSTRADEPPPRHAVICDWPWCDDRELQKARQKEIAAVIAGRSALILR